MEYRQDRDRGMRVREEGVMEVNSLSLSTGRKGPRQSVGALVSGQSYMSLCIKAQRWATAGGAGWGGTEGEDGVEAIER